MLAELNNLYPYYFAQGTDGTDGIVSSILKGEFSEAELAAKAGLYVSHARGGNLTSLYSVHHYGCARLTG